jgi:hypothetical protein
MKIDGHPFPLENMVEINDPGNKGKAKVLTSERAKQTWVVDPKMQISADELNSQSRYDQGQSSGGPRRTITSQMLLNKYQRRQDRERRDQEERSQRDEDHWRCPFFAFYWNEGWRLPSVDNCPECNRSREDVRSSKRQCHDDRRRCLISKDRREEKHIPVHERLERKVEEQDLLEDEANDVVPEEEPLNREIEHQCTYHYESEMYPRWCPGGFTKS